MRISTLESIVAGGGRIALWGWGREGRATYRAVRSRLPGLPLTLFCVEAHADLSCDLIGGEEADAADVTRQPVRILGEDLHGVGAVGTVDAHRAARADAVRVQEHHDVADRALSLPVVDDAARPHRARR